MFGVGDDGASDASIFVVVVFGEEGSDVLKVVFFFFLVVVLSRPPKGSFDVDGDIASRRNFLFRSLSLPLITFDKNLSISRDRSIWIVLEHAWCSRMSPIGQKNY